eukprot:3005458-Prorocentrum_lima.AAC.1
MCWTATSIGMSRQGRSARYKRWRAASWYAEGRGWPCGDTPLCRSMAAIRPWLCGTQPWSQGLGRCRGCHATDGFGRVLKRRRRLGYIPHSLESTDITKRSASGRPNPVRMPSRCCGNMLPAFSTRAWTRTSGRWDWMAWAMLGTAK